MTKQVSWSDDDLAELLETIEEIREQCGDPCGSTREFVGRLMWDGFAIPAHAPHDALYDLGFAVGSLSAAAQAMGRRIEEVIEARDAARTIDALRRAKLAL